MGAILITVGLILPPYALNYGMLLFFRLIFSPGAAATSAMLVALLADYPKDDGVNKAKGKASGFLGLFAGLGAITALFLFLRIPSLLTSLSPIAAGRVMFLCVSGIIKNYNPHFQAHLSEQFSSISPNLTKLKFFFSTPF